MIWVRFGPRSHFLGKKPQNKNLLVGKPEADNAAMAALGPGIGLTAQPGCLGGRTILNPGSDINGVPASLTKATSLLCSSSKILSMLSASLKSRTEIYFGG